MKNPQPTHRHQPQSTIPKPVQPAPDPESKIHMILTFPSFFFFPIITTNYITKLEMTTIPLRFFQILRSFSAFTTGFAFAIWSLPIPLKSNPHPCPSGYRCDPHSVNPHLHLKPVSPTRLLQVAHRLGATFSSAAEARGASTAAEDDDDDEGAAIGSAGEETAGEGGDGGARVWLRTNLAEEDCCSLSWRSR